MPMSSRAVLVLALVVLGCAPVTPKSNGDAGGGGHPAPGDDAASSGDGAWSGDSPWYADSDGDGVADAVEVAAGTDPDDASESPRTRGDFFFAVPYQADPEPARDTLVLGTALQRADVHFMIDTSISMQRYIDSVRGALTDTIIPGITAAIPDVWLGVGQFDVCPTSDWRPDICRGIVMDATSTGDASAVTDALASLTADCLPVHEPYAQAAWLWATGETARFPGMGARECPAGTIGLGCVRPDALPILVVIGDEPFAESHRSSWESCASDACAECLTFPQPSDVISAFEAMHGRLLVLGPTGNSREWGPIVSATGAVDAAGQPLIFPAAGTATSSIDSAVVEAITRLAASTPLSVTARAVDLDDDGVDATTFIDRIEPNLEGGVADRRDASRVCAGGLATFDADRDGRADGFADLAPGTDVCFDVVPRRNETVPPREEPQIFRARIDVIGDGVTVLDQRVVYFLVPTGEGPPILI